MPLPKTFTVPGAQLQVELVAGETSIFVGANGSGKSRLAVAIEEELGEGAFRIAAQRALKLDTKVSKSTERAAEKRLRIGIADDPDGYNVASHRRGLRYGGNPAVHPLDDFDALLQLLFAQQANAGTEFLKAHEKDAAAERPTTTLAKLTATWERIFPNRPLHYTSDDIIVAFRNADGQPAPYGAGEMSDGERAVFYMVGQILAAPAATVLIFDEPELHVHRAILGRVWDELETARKDCSFILITHDLDFAASRGGRKYVLRDFAPPANWLAEEVPEDTGFDEQTTTLILGSRQNVLFVESDGRGTDLAIYRACYPGWTVIPRGGCESVIHSVKSMQANKELHRVRCAGIIDNDGRDAATIAFLAAKGVATLPVSEIENLFALPSVATAILKDDSFADSDISAKLSDLENAIYADATNPRHEEQVVLAHVRRVLDTTLKKLSYERSASEADLIAAFATDILSIDVTLLITQTRQKLRDAVASRSLQDLLRLYDRKGALLEEVAKNLKGYNNKRFVAWAKRAFGDPKKTELRNALAAELPAVTAV